MSERDFWIIVRRALLAIAKAIEVRYNLGSREKSSLESIPASQIARPA